MKTILFKIKIGDKIVSNGVLYTITGQIDAVTWKWETADGGQGIFTFGEDQTEDNEFMIIG